MRRLFLTFLFALLAPVALAQSVNWAPGDSGDPSDLLLVFRGATPSGPGQPILPAVSGFTFTYVGSAQQTSVINGVVSQSVVLSYRLRSQAGGPVRIPAFDVQTSAGPVRVPAYSGPALPAAADLGVRSTLAAEANTFWAGEVFPLTYVVSVPRRASSQLGSDIVWNSAPLAAEAWSLPVQSDVVVNGEPRVNVTYRAQAYARTPGTVKLNAAQQVVNIATGSFGFFGAPRVEQLSVVSNQPELTIKPLPGNAPAGFNGAVGDFKLTAKVVPEKANVGDPVTWTLTLEGTGNWPEIAGLPAREVSRDFQVVQPKAKKTNAEGKLFEATLVEDVVLIPTKPGTYKIGPVSYACFDPKTGDYKTLTSDSVTVTITGSAAAPAVTLNVPANTGATSQPKGPDLGAAANPRTKLPDEPTGPSPIPGDPIAGGGNALAPLGHATFLVLISSPVALLALLWGGLALRRATQTDPLRGRRLAQKQLRATLARLPGADAATRARLLLDWQHQSIAFWGIAHAAPAAATLGEPAWKTLWEESDRALYSASAELPGDWITRAEAAVKAQRLPAFSAFSLLLPRNLLPFFFLVVLALTTAPGRLGAADATADYRAGKFAAAEKTWRAELKANPTNWAARHNLGLALAQEQKWAESAAHTTAAFVQNPSDARVSRELATSYPKAGYTVEGLSQFVQPDRWMKLAMLASPAGWQLALAGGIALLCGALALALLRAYGWRARAVPAAAIVLLIAGLILTPVAEFGRRSYGAAGDPRAMLAWGASSTLRSIPTEADNTQQTTPLAAGTIGVVDNTYLDWVHLSFRNGQAGWSKKNELLPLWK